MMDVSTSIVDFGASSTSTVFEFYLRLEPIPHGLHHRVNVMLLSHDEYETAWAATAEAHLDEAGDLWRGTVPWDPAAAPALVSVGGLAIPQPLEDGEIFPPDPIPIVVVGDTRVIGKPAVDGTGAWVDGEADYEDLVVHRDAHFDKEIIVDDASDSCPVWSVLILVEHVLLTRNTQVPGLRVFPLSQAGNEARHAAVAGILTRLSSERGMTVPGPLSFETREPLVLVELPKVRAVDAQAAMQRAAELARRLLDLVGLNRGDSPTLIAAAAGRHDEGGVAVLESAAILDRRYAGNLIGGPISGEGIGLLNRQWDAATDDPRLFLWLRLLNEAMADARWDYNAFRFFNLLEGIAKEVLPKRQVVLDQTGKARLQGDGKSKYTTEQARGAIFLLLQRVGYSLAHETRPDGTSSPRDLWAETELWTAVRNQVAHTGSWEIAPGVKASDGWAKNEARLSGPWARDSLVRELRQAVEATIHAALRGNL